MARKRSKVFRSGEGIDSFKTYLFLSYKNEWSMYIFYANVATVP